MAKEKTVTLSGDRDLGTVVKRLASGMFETSSGDKVPPLAGVTIGSKVKLEEHRFVIDGGETKAPVNTVDAESAKNAELLARIDALEKQLGEKGSASKGTTIEDVPENKPTSLTPPKVGE